MSCMKPTHLALFLVAFIVFMICVRVWMKSDEQEEDYAASTSSSALAKVMQQLHSGVPVRESFPKTLDLVKLKELSTTNATTLFLYKVMLGNGNNSDKRSPSYGMLFCMYKPQMLQGTGDVRPLIRGMQSKSVCAKTLVNLMAITLDELAHYYHVNGISNPCNKFNLQVHQTEPIIHMNRLIAACAADLIPLAANNQVTV